MNKIPTDEILKRLLDGNKNFANPNTQHEICASQTLAALQKEQNPGAIVFCCSDSRVSPEIIFDCGLGVLFVVRTAGNAIGPNILETIEYGVKHLEIPLLIILGHQDCGVMKYALDAELYDDDFENLIFQVQSLKNEKNITCFNDLAKAHTKITKNRLIKKSAVIKNAVENGELKVVRAYFSFDTGLVEILE